MQAHSQCSVYTYIEVMDILNKQEFSFIIFIQRELKKAILKQVFYEVEPITNLLHNTKFRTLQEWSLSLSFGTWLALSFYT